MTRLPRLPVLVVALLALAVGVGLGVGSLAGGSGVRATTTAAMLPAPSASPSAAPADEAGTALDTALARVLAANPGVDLAVEVKDHRTGQTYAFNGDETFVTASIVKVQILATVLLRQGGLSDSQLDLATMMIEDSDNDAADKLWNDAGNALGMATAAQTFGLTRTIQGRDNWGTTTTTVADQVVLLDAIADPNGPLGSLNQTILDLMGSVSSDQEWGISAAARTGETVQIKNGWDTLANDDNLWEVNSIGRVTGPSTDLTIAVLSRGGDDFDDEVDLVEQVAKLARDTLDPAG